MNTLKLFRIFLFVSVMLVIMGFCAISQTLNYEQYKLKNGLQVMLIEHGNVDATTISVYVNVGKKNETPGLQGISEFTAQALLFGNAKYDKIKQQDLLYTMGTDISASSNDKYTKISSIFLYLDLESGMDLFASALRQPLFPEAEVKQQIDEFMQSNDTKKMDISELASRFADFFVFGVSNPLGRNTYVAQVNKFTVKDYKEFYDFNYTPKNTKIVVAGKLDKEKIKQIIEKYFGNWETQYGEVNQVSLESPVFKGKEYGFVNRDSATQVCMMWAKKAAVISDKDLLAFKLSTVIFNKKLFEEVRDKLGKTYGINLSYNEKQNNGIYTVSTQTRSKEMFSTLQAFEKTLDNFYNNGITENELKITKTKLKNAFLSVNNPFAIIEYFNPLIYSDIKKRLTFLTDIDALTVENVNKTIKKYYNPETYKLIIAGNEKELADQLTKFKNLQKFANNVIEN